jgi:hypothetical protein
LSGEDNSDGEGEAALPTDGFKIKIRVNFGFLFNFFQNIVIFLENINKYSY